MIRLTTFLLVAAGMASAGAASAQGYMGLGVGQSRVGVDCSGTTSCDKTDPAFKLFAGAMFTPSWGLEGAYYDQGRVRLTASDPTLGTVTGEFNGDGIGLFGVAVLPLDKASVFAKLGVVSARVKLDAASSVFGAAGASERHTQAAWGLGAGYALSRFWGGRLEYERLRLKFMDEKVNAGLWTLSATYRF